MLKNRSATTFCDLERAFFNAEEADYAELCHNIEKTCSLRISKDSAME